MTAWKLAGGDGTQEEKDSCRAEKRGGGCEGCSIIYPTLPSAQLLMEDKRKYVQITTRGRFTSGGFSPSFKVYDSVLLGLRFLTKKKHFMFQSFGV